jgi:regulator of protease activity HflC (stomatin/prohibitin superfamily)
MRKTSSFSVLISLIICVIGAWLALAFYQQSHNPQSAWIAVIGLLMAIVVYSAIQVANPWEMAIVLRLGHFHSIRGPGLFVIVPIIDAIPYWIDTRVITTSFAVERGILRRSPWWATRNGRRG